MKKQALGLSLAAVLLLSALASCGETAADPTPSGTPETKAPAGDTEAVTEDAVPHDSLPDVDMNGFSFNILHATQDSIGWINTILDAEKENGDLINDAVFRRNTATEDRFNCKLNYTEEAYDKITSNYKKIVTSGDGSYDIILELGTSVIGLIDYMADINNIPHLDLDATYWNPNASAIFRIGGKQVAAGGNYSLGCVSTANCLLFNKRIYGDLQMDETLYDMVRAGTWTTDALFTVAKAAERDLNGDGKMDSEDLMGATGTGKSFHHGLMIGAGMHYIEMDKDGYPYLSVASNDRAISLMEKIVNYEIQDPYAYYGHTSNIHSEEYPVDFASGGCLFQVTWPHHMVEYRDMKDDFGVVPMPKYDQAQTKYYANMANCELTTLPRSYDESRLENIGILLESMSFYNQYNVIPVYKDVLLNAKVTRDADSSAMLDLVFAGTTYDFAINIWQDLVGSPIGEKIFLKKSTAIASTLEGLISKVEQKSEELHDSIENMP